MTTVVVPPPGEARIGEGLAPWWPERLFKAVHIGQSSALFVSPRTGTYLALTDASHGLVPGGVCLPRPWDFQVTTQAALRRGALDLGPWRALPPPVIERVRLDVRPGPVHPAALAALGAGVTSQTFPVGPMSPEPARQAAADLVAAARAEDCRETRALATQLIGAGPGSTPSGDDVMIGVLAGLELLGATRAARTVRDVLPGLLHRTTTLSQLGLAAAVAGRFAERIHYLLAALGHPAAVPSALHKATGWGATSGFDLLAGIVAAARLHVAHPTLGNPIFDKRTA